MESKLRFLGEVVEAIQRIHGRLGKLLISQYLCGSQNAKIQKLNLHRLGGFGLLKSFRQADAVSLLDTLLAVGILRQQEVNRNRPTVSVAPELIDVRLRQELLTAVVLPAKLEAKILRLAATRSAAADPRVSAPLPVPPSAAAVTAASAAAPLFESAADEPLSPPAAPPPVAPATTAAPATADWQWSVKLFQARFSWQEVCAIRRISDQELAVSMCEAARGGCRIDRSWLAPAGDELRTAGQQRVLREIQRRAAAGVK